MFFTARQKEVAWLAEEDDVLRKDAWVKKESEKAE